MKKTLLALLFALSFALVCGCAEAPKEQSTVKADSTEDSQVELDRSSDESQGLSSEESLAIDLPSEDDQSSHPQDTQSVESEESQPEEPEESQPEEPEESQPEEPEESQPEEPEESQPEEPEESQPEESQPEEPEESQPEESEDEPVYDIGDAEFIESGYLLYNGAAYSQARYNAEAAQQYANVYARYAELFPELGIHVINHPASVYNITNPAVAAMVVDQGEVLDKMQSHIFGDVNFVNLKTIFKEHAGEYLYFKSDYHWTQLGAYYAYCAFAESVGLAPTPLQEFEMQVITDSFIGHTNDIAHDDRILSFVDTVYAYMPTKEHTMEVYRSDMTLYKKYDNVIRPDVKNYSCFLSGDQPFTVINVPENDQSKTILVIKESSGNAFVPFLTEHYGNIIVIDPRHIRPDVRQVVAEYGVKDIILFATASTTSRMDYCTLYRQLIGE